MSFDTITFWIFFALALGLWRALPFHAAKASALLASLCFYGWWDWRYLGLIVASALIDYTAGSRIAGSSAPGRRRTWLCVSLVSNLGLLALFKYAPFLARNATGIAHALGFEADWKLAGWIVPVGISFYTFQTLSYTIDIYRGQLRPASSFRDFLLFVSFYPQLVAGPIVRANALLPQLERRRNPSALRIQVGIEAVVLGLFLKVCVADNLAPEVERIFATRHLGSLPPLEAWLGTVYFSCQIFADFAGYSGIAIGLAHLLGLRFPENFRAPYISAGLSEFWTRWHITLSQWLRDYLYIPLGGSWRGRARTSINLLVTMLLGGLWHGAAWTFLAWGGLHGLGLVVERALRGDARQKDFKPPRSAGAWLHRLTCVLVVQIFVLITWVFFRAPDLPTAAAFLERMLIAPLHEPLGLAALPRAWHVWLCLPVVVVHVGQLGRECYGLRRGPYQRAVVTALLLLVLIVLRRPGRPDFLYFQF